jgi:hypothetical protein
LVEGERGGGVVSEPAVIAAPAGVVPDSRQVARRFPGRRPDVQFTTLLIVVAVG